MRRLASRAIGATTTIPNSASLESCVRRSLLKSGTVSTLRGASSAVPTYFRNLSNSRVTCAHEITCAQRGLFEIWSVGRKHLPACDRLSERVNRSHAGEVASQARVMLFSGGQPDPVVGSTVAPVAKDEHDPVFDVHGDAAEHRPSHWGRRGQGLELEFMRDGLARLRAEDAVFSHQCRGLPTSLRHKARIRRTVVGHGLCTSTRLNAQGSRLKAQAWTGFDVG